MFIKVLLHKSFHRSLHSFYSMPCVFTTLRTPVTRPGKSFAVLQFLSVTFQFLRLLRCFCFERVPIKSYRKLLLPVPSPPPPYGLTPCLSRIPSSPPLRPCDMERRLRMDSFFPQLFSSLETNRGYLLNICSLSLEHGDQ